MLLISPPPITPHTLPQVPSQSPRGRKVPSRRPQQGPVLLTFPPHFPPANSHSMGVYDGMFFLVRLNSDWPAHCPRSPTSPARSRRGSWVYAHAPATASTALTTALPTTALQPPPVHPTRHSRMTSIMPACTLGTHSNQTTIIIVVQPADASPARRTDLDNSCRATGETRSRPPRLPTSARASELSRARSRAPTPGAGGTPAQRAGTQQYGAADSFGIRPAGRPPRTKIKTTRSSRRCPDPARDVVVLLGSGGPRLGS